MPRAVKTNREKINATATYLNPYLLIHLIKVFSQAKNNIFHQNLLFLNNLFSV